MIVDSSALLATFLHEPAAAWCAQQMDEAPSLAMSTVNLAEVLVHLRKRGDKGKALEGELRGSGIAFIAPDVEVASMAAHARLTLPLNLGLQSFPWGSA